jgi:[ribosomal protein S18]-alanine N-acetyltransferase
MKFFLEFVPVTPYIIGNYISSINHFFERNQESYSFFHPHEFSYIGLWNEIINKKKDYYVFLIDADTIAGYGMLRGWDEGFEIPSLGILTDINYRGQGISSKIMDHLHEIAKKEGSDKIRLTVYKENKIAISLYNKLGYVFSDKNENELIGIKKL